MAEPWYILESRRKDYLHNKTLYRRDYPCRAGEHEHCEFCWARFSALPEDLHGGSLRAKAGSARTAWNSFRTCLAGPSRKPRMTRNKIMPVNAAPVGTRGLFWALRGVV